MMDETIAPIRELGQTAPILDEAALLIFQKQWRSYQRLLDLDYLSHKDVLRILRSILTTEFDYPFSFLDLACGDAFGMPETLGETRLRRYLGVDLSMPALELAAKRLKGMTFPVELIHGDIVAGLAQLNETFDVVWCGLCLHHLETADKRRALRAIRGRTGKTCLIYEPSRHDDEDRDAFMARFLRDHRSRWEGLSESDWVRISSHITACDLPERETDWLTMGLEAGFGRAEKLFTSASDFASLYRFDV